MMMINIPRRKIYEKLLEFEDGMIDMQILIHKDENYEKFIEKFNTQTYKIMQSSYLDIKALIIMFLENKKFEKIEDFEKEIDDLKNNQNELNNKLKTNKNLSDELKKILEIINEEYEKNKIIKSLEHGKEQFVIFDKFNHLMPKFLELRREDIIEQNK